MKFHRNGAFAPVPRPITKSDDDNGQRDTGSIDDGSFGGCFVLWHYLQPQQMLFLMLPPLRTCTFDALAHVIRYGAIGQKPQKQTKNTKTNRLCLRPQHVSAAIETLFNCGKIRCCRVQCQPEGIRAHAAFAGTVQTLCVDAARDGKAYALMKLAFQPSWSVCSSTKCSSTNSGSVHHQAPTSGTQQIPRKHHAWPKQSVCCS